MWFRSSGEILVRSRLACVFLRGYTSVQVPWPSSLCSAFGPGFGSGVRFLPVVGCSNEIFTPYMSADGALRAV